MQEGRWGTGVVPKRPRELIRAQKAGGISCYHGILNGNGCQSLLVTLDLGLIWRHSDAMSFAPKRPKAGYVYLSEGFNFDVRVLVCIFKTIWGAGGVPKNA